MINFWFYGHCTYIITILVIQQKYNTSDYYGIIKGQISYSARVLFYFIFFRAKIPFLIKLKQILQKMATYRTNRPKAL